jgi:uncharacterized protein (TIGR02677 family)
MRALLVNLRRIAAGADRQQSRYADLVRLARWFDESPDDRAHELWAATFGLYPARHLSFAADDDADPVAPTESWWQTPVAHVPVSLRTYGERKSGGRAGGRADFSTAKRARLAERQRLQNRRAAALAELGSHAGTLGEVQLSDEGRTALLDLYAQALSRHGRPLDVHAVAVADTPLLGNRLRLEVRAAPGATVRVTSPQGRLALVDMSLEVTLETNEATAGPDEWRAEA